MFGHILTLLLILFSSSGEENYDMSKCGVSNEPTVSTRSIGGEVASIEEWPWYVGFINATAGDFLHIPCGGTLIHPRWVLTAAHCVRGLPHVTKVMTGYSLSREASNSPQQILNIKSSVVHPDYAAAPDSMIHDIALLELDGVGARLDRWTNTACLPKLDETFPVDTTCFVVGFGKTNEGDEHYSEQLRSVDLKIVSNQKCAESYHRTPFNTTGNITYYGVVKIFQEQICTAGAGKDACNGDSGGGLICKRNSANQQCVVVGVVSVGLGCAMPDYPGVHTRVSEYLPWIEHVTGLPFYDGTYVDPKKYFIQKNPTRSTF